MSEFQRYEFLSIDKPLSREAKKEINTWSSRTQAKSHSAIFTYSYGDFPQDEIEAVYQYFDMMLYEANWGTRQLILKIPKDLIGSFKKLQTYDILFENFADNGIEITKRGKFVIIDIKYNRDEGFEWREEEAQVADFVGIREEIINGNYSSLVPLWFNWALAKYNEGELEEERLEIPQSFISHHITQISENAIALMDFFEVDDGWIEVLKKYNNPIIEQVEVDEQALIQNLSEDKKNEFLERLWQGEQNLSIKFKNELARVNTKHQAIENVIPIQSIFEDFMK